MKFETRLKKAGGEPAWREFAELGAAAGALPAARLDLLGDEEAIAVRIEPVETLREPRGLGFGFGSAHAAIAVGIDLLEVLGAAPFVGGTKLVRRHLAVRVRVDHVEMASDHGQRRG